MNIGKDAFLKSYVGLLLVLFCYQYFVPQLAISLAINSHHSSILDLLCVYGTFLGDGWFVCASCIVLFFFKPRLALLILISYALSAGFTQLLKHTLFTSMHRPLWHIEELGITSHYLVPGAEHNYNNSFPSGHSTSAFAVFGMLALYVNKNWQRVLFFILAFFTAFTRIYLLQHFLIDTCVGSIIGSTTASLIYFGLYQKGRLQFLFAKIKKEV
ncbi:MAG: hypothetical protein CFE21_12105 [Bacteroidetes bacterium B1(2017)]|nr:MAG: hypothetical protein CFE21_12105 [Bacteroidetes bacterium B1(2017)]